MDTKTLVCVSCGKEKPESEFWRATKYSRNLGFYKSVPTALYCKACSRLHRTLGGKSSSMSGFVYLIRVVGTDKVKIGFSKNVEKRIIDLQHSCPFTLEVVFKQYYEYANRIENELHIKYLSKNIRGEWFSLTLDDIEDIKSMCDSY